MLNLNLEAVCGHCLLLLLKALDINFQRPISTTALSLMCFQNVVQSLSLQQIYGWLMSEIVLSLINKVISRINVLIRISIFCL